MSVSNGQLANQTTFNNGLASKIVDNNYTGKQDLSNTDGASGSAVINVQKELNGEASFTGRTLNGAKDQLPAWSSNDIGLATDNLKDRGDALTVFTKALSDVAVTLTGTQALTNKDYDGGAASNTRRITLPKDTKANLDLLTRKKGTIVYASDTDKVYKDDGVSLVEIGSGTAAAAFQESLGNGNGVTLIFGPLTNIPADEDSILVLVDSIVSPKTDWSLSGSSIVFGTAPAAGQSIYVYYIITAATPPPAPAGTERLEYRTLSAGEIAAKQLTLANTPTNGNKLMLDLIGGGAQELSGDFTVAANILSWLGLGLDGVLAAGDKLRIHYWS
jgi:hypothetical protein